MTSSPRAVAPPDPLLFPPSRSIAHVPLPAFIRAGDLLAEVLVYVVLLLGASTLGFAKDSTLVGWAYFLCGLIGVWGAVGFAFNRWQAHSLRTARWFLLGYGFVLAWTGLQLVPLPTGLVTALSPAWSEAVVNMKAAGLTPPSSLTIAVNVTPGSAMWYALAAGFGLFLGVVPMASRRRVVTRLITAVVLLALLAAGIGLVNFVFSRYNARAWGVVYNPNHFAALVLMGIPLYFAGLSVMRRLVRAFRGSLSTGQNPVLMLYGLGVMFVLAWMMSLSRGSLLFGLVLLVGWALLENHGRQRELVNEELYVPFRATVAGVLGTIVAIVLMLALLEAANLQDRLVGRLNQGLVEGGDQGRAAFWRATVAGLLDSPWVGLGLEGVEGVLRRYSETPMVKMPMRSHGDYVQLAAELGVVGTAVVIGVAVMALMSLLGDWRSTQERFYWSERLMRRAAWVSALTCAAHATTDFHLRIPLIGFVFLIVLAVAITPGSLEILRRRSGTMK